MVTLIRDRIERPRQDIEMATVHRPGDIGIDLRAGACARELRSTDYRPVEILDEHIQWAIVHRPNDSGVDLPAGASARGLAPTDYKIVEVGEDPATSATPAR